MATMTTNEISRASLEAAIWKARDEIRGALPADQALEVVLDVLLWSRWVPSSDRDLVGFFDAMRSLSIADEWKIIQQTISERSGAPLSPVATSSQLKTDSLDRLRNILLPIGRALNSGDRLPCRVVIEALVELKVDNRKTGEHSCSPSMGGF